MAQVHVSQPLVSRARPASKPKSRLNPPPAARGPPQRIALQCSRMKREQHGSLCTKDSRETHRIHSPRGTFLCFCKDSVSCSRRAQQPPWRSCTLPCRIAGRGTPRLPRSARDPSSGSIAVAPAHEPRATTAAPHGFRLLTPPPRRTPATIGDLSTPGRGRVPDLDHRIAEDLVVRPGGAHPDLLDLHLDTLCVAGVHVAVAPADWVRCVRRDGGAT